MIYQMGIIDPLTNFNAKKNIEYSAKRCRFGHRMSCVPPQIYANRFMGFMKEIFVEESAAATLQVSRSIEVDDSDKLLKANSKTKN